MTTAAVPIFVLNRRFIEKAPRVANDLLALASRTPPPFSVVCSVGSAPGEQAIAEASAPILPICLDSGEILFGPLLAPPRSPCASCLKHWLDLRFYDRSVDVVLEDAVAEVLLDTLTNWFTVFRRDGLLPELETSAISMRVPDRVAVAQPIYRRANCATCGAAPTPLSPNVHCSAWTGIVNRMEVTAAPVAGAFRATASWTPPIPIDGCRPQLLRQRSYGRGRTRVEAQLGCIGEALERYSLIYRGDEDLTRARLADIDGIAPNDTQLFSDAQYSSRKSWNSTADEIFFVPEPFQPDLPADWLPARALNGRRRTTFVAAATCLMWYEFRQGEPGFARADTIGCAGGATFDSALYSALLELVERDSMAIWWDNRVRRPAVVLDSFDCSDLDAVVEGLNTIGRKLFLLDCTTDIGIPSYVAVAPRFDGSEPLIGGAADLSPSVAAYRAASEVGQVWYDAVRSQYLSTTVASWLFHATVADHSYLAPADAIEVPLVARPPRRTWEAVVEHLEAVGLQAYAIDQSRSDVSTRTVRAIVPGLRHIWNRRARGRLYDVPVALGWRRAPALEAELNPIRCMV